MGKKAGHPLCTGNIVEEEPIIGGQRQVPPGDMGDHIECPLLATRIRCGLEGVKPSPSSDP